MPTSMRREKNFSALLKEFSDAPKPTDNSSKTLFRQFMTFIEGLIFKYDSSTDTEKKAQLTSVLDYPIPAIGFRTILHLLAHFGSLDALRRLLSWGSREEFAAAMTVQDKNGNTPLHLAFLSEEAATDKVKTLIEHGASLTTKDKYGRNPLHIAASYFHQDALPFYISYIRDLYKTVFKARQHELANAFYEEDQDHRSAISIAEARFPGSHVWELIRQDPDFAAPGLPMAQALYDAAKEGNVARIEFLSKRTGFKDVLNQSINGDTPLLIAVKNGKTDAAIQLVNFGASIESVSASNGKDVYSIALQLFNSDFILRLNASTIDEDMLVRVRQKAARDIYSNSNTNYIQEYALENSRQFLPLAGRRPTKPIQMSGQQPLSSDQAIAPDIATKRPMNISLNVD